MRCPGLLTRSRPEITGMPVWSYLSVIVRFLKPLSSPTWISLSQPSECRSLARFILKLEYGKTTSDLFTIRAFRIRVNISEIVSFIINLPGGLNYSGNLAIRGQFPEANTTEVKVAHIAALAAAAPASPHYPGGIFRVGAGSGCFNVLG